MSIDEQSTDTNQQRDSYHPYAERLGPAPVPSALVREVASGLKSLSKVLPYEEYASVVHRIARVRWQCQLAASHAQHGDENI